MRIRYGFLGLFLVIAPSAYALEVASPPVLAPLKQQAQAAQLSAQFLTRYSYKPVPLDDALSAKIMNRFIKSLDPDRVFFPAGGHRQVHVQQRQDR
jgi:carboxyl-terminal processing protease